MNEILALKLNRAVWIAYLEEGKFQEAINHYDFYCSLLVGYKYKNAEEKAIITFELLYSRDLFLKKLEPIIDKLLKEEKFADALMCCNVYFKQNPKNFMLSIKYINCLNKVEQHDLAKVLLDNAVNLEADIPNRDTLIAQAYAQCKVYDKAIMYQEKFIENNINVAAGDYNNLGCFYHDLFRNNYNIDDAQKSVDAFCKASSMESNPVFIKNITIVASKLNQQEVVRDAWNKLLKINKLSNDDKFDYAAFCLKNKDFESWHKYFEARFDKEHGKTQFPKLNKPKWNGIKDISKSTLLVHYEQGFGDTILMWGYVPRLKKYAKHIIYVVQKELYDLLKDNEYDIEVMPNTTDLSKIKYDYYLPSMSIPTVLKYGIEEIPIGEGFIKANSKLVKEFKSKYFNNDKLKIGLSLKGHKDGDLTRDIKVQDLLPLDELNGVEFYCFTKDFNDTEFEIFKNNKVINIAKGFNNFADTAAAMENVDLFISTDNCLLNLAGALGKKTFGLFNWNNQFRWFDLSGDDIVWLSSVKPFVNEKMNDWSISINKITDEINSNLLKL